MTDFHPEALWQALAVLPRDPAGARYAVALSGGFDSVVLLEGMARLAGRLGPGRLRALHVHHGLQAAADAWVASCTARCATLGVPLQVIYEDARAAPGESPEARARDVRYAALRAALAPGEILLTAHQADDQLETVLLQLLRGAGVAGLAAMPPDAPFGTGRHQRPLLAFPRASLRRWVAAEGLEGWCADPANEDPRLARNHLRLAVLPGIRAHWPGAAGTVGRAARHCAEAAGLLEELAALDAQGCAAGDALDLVAMRELSAARRRNLVRWQARRLGLPVPDERRLATLLHQAFTASRDAQPEIRWPGALALRHRDRLWLAAEADLLPPPPPMAWPDPERPLALGAGLGTLALEPSRDGGLHPRALGAGPWRVRVRHGGERLVLPGRTGHHALKTLWQEAGVPPWVRARMPLLEIDGRLAAAGEVWVDEHWWTPSGGGGFRLCWRDSRLPGQRAFVVAGRTF